MAVVLSLLGLLAIFGCLFGGAIPSASEVEDESDERNPEEHWSELVSADKCDTFWDPPNDDI